MSEMYHAALPLGGQPGHERRRIFYLRARVYRKIVAIRYCWNAFAADVLQHVGIEIISP